MTFIPSQIPSVEIFENVGQSDILEVYVTTDGEYTVSGNTLTLNTVPADSTPVKVTHFSKHDVQQIDLKNLDIVKRTTLTPASAGDIEYNPFVSRINSSYKDPTIDAEYVWVTVNGVLKTKC